MRSSFDVCHVAVGVPGHPRDAGLVRVIGSAQASQVPPHQTGTKSLYCTSGFVLGGIVMLKQERVFSKLLAQS